MKNIFAVPFFLASCSTNEDAFIATAAEASCACYASEAQETGLLAGSGDFRACASVAEDRYRKELEGIECASLYDRDSMFSGDLPLVETCIDVLRAASESPASSCSSVRDRGGDPREIDFHLREWCHDICKLEG